MQEFFWIGAGSLAIIICTGIIRFVYYNKFKIREEQENIKKRLLIIKHILLGSMILIGMTVEYYMVFKG